MRTLVFLGNKAIGYNCLQYTLSQQTVLGFRVVAVGTAEQGNLLDEDTSIPALCAAHQVPVFTDMSKIPTCDYLVSVQYHRILKASHIAQAQRIAVNLHLAPLPEYRGCNQFSFAIADESKIFGATIHRLETGIDSGDILWETRFAILPNCWVKDLYRQTQIAAQELYYNSLPDLIADNYVLTPQSSLLDKRGTTYHHRSDIVALKEISLDWSAEKITRHIRATYFPPFEPPYFLVNGQKIYLVPEGK